MKYLAALLILLVFTQHIRATTVLPGFRVVLKGREKTADAVLGISDSMRTKCAALVISANDDCELYLNQKSLGLLRKSNAMVVYVLPGYFEVKARPLRDGDMDMQGISLSKDKIAKQTSMAMLLPLPYEQPVPSGMQVFKQTPVPAIFPGGDSALNRFFTANCRVKYPAGFPKFSGEVRIQCVIDRKGRVRLPQIILPLDSISDKSALDGVGKLPDFSPAMVESNTVNSYHIFHIPFHNP